jgi:hypothetical protein
MLAVELRATADRLQRPQAVYILVDIDKIPEKQTRQGLRRVSERFAGLALPPAAGSDDASLDVKLYGGWFERSTLTKDAQALCAEIQQKCPAMLKT